MKSNTKAFLRNAVILTAAVAVICIFMPQWGVAQVLVVVLAALLCVGQWALYFYMKKTK